jgi:homocysteine S-methyltransferase
MASALQRLLDEQGFAVLDGGLATELEARGHVLDSGALVGGAAPDAPGRDRGRARWHSSRPAPTASPRRATRRASGASRASAIDAAEGERLLRLSVEVARAARDAFWSEPRTERAASSRSWPRASARTAPISPTAPSTTGGTCWKTMPGRSRSGETPDRVTRAELAAFHRPRLELLAGAAPDVLALETMPSLAELEVLVALLAEVDHPGAWVSFSCRDGGAPPGRERDRGGGEEV